MKPHVIYIEDEKGKPTEQLAAYVHDASVESVKYVLGLPIDDANTHAEARSGWVWVRLQNGALLLGTFPQADAYTAVEVDAEYPG